MKATQLGPHHQHRVGARAGGVGAEVGLRGGQARHRRLHQGDRARDRDHRRHRERHLPGLGADAAGAKADRRARRARRHQRRRGEDASCWPRSSRRCSSRRPSNWASWPCSCARRRPTTCAAWPGTWTAAGSRSERCAAPTRGASHQRVICTLPLTLHRHGALAGLDRQSTSSALAAAISAASRAIGGAQAGGSAGADVDFAHAIAGVAELLRVVGRLGAVAWRSPAPPRRPSTFSRARATGCSRRAPSSACVMRPVSWRDARCMSRPSTTSSALPCQPLMTCPWAVARRQSEKLPVCTSTWPGLLRLARLGQRRVERLLQLRSAPRRRRRRRGWSIKRHAQHVVRHLDGRAGRPGQRRPAAAGRRCGVAARPSEHAAEQRERSNAKCKRVMRSVLDGMSLRCLQQCAADAVERRARVASTPCPTSREPNATPEIVVTAGQVPGRDIGFQPRQNRRCYKFGVANEHARQHSRPTASSSSTTTPASATCCAAT